MTSDDWNTTEVDVQRLASMGGWRAAVCVEPDGTESFWLLSPDAQGDPGCACASCARHEQSGPLPADIGRELA